ncbi:MAG: hypothetical protein QXO75_03930 [Nitrososphaerota archaeon]
MLVGLSYLATNNWKYTGELTDSGYEQLWEYHSNSVRVWLEDWKPEPEEIEEVTLANQQTTLEQEKTSPKLVRNLKSEWVIDELYEMYAEDMKKLQVTPVKPKTFAEALKASDQGFVVKRMRIEEGKFKGQIKSVTYASFVGRDKKDKPKTEELDPNRREDEFEAYITRAPLTFEVCSHLHGQPIDMEEKISENHSKHILELPTWMRTHFLKAQNPCNTGSADTKEPVRIWDEQGQTPLKDETGQAGYKPPLSPSEPPFITSGTDEKGD